MSLTAFEKLNKCMSAAMGANVTPTQYRMLHYIFSRLSPAAWCNGKCTGLVLDEDMGVALGVKRTDRINSHRRQLKKLRIINYEMRSRGVYVYQVNPPSRWLEKPPPTMDEMQMDLPLSMTPEVDQDTPKSGENAPKEGGFTPETGVPREAEAKEEGFPPGTPLTKKKLDLSGLESSSRAYNRKGLFPPNPLSPFPPWPDFGNMLDDLADAVLKSAGIARETRAEFLQEHGAIYCLKAVCCLPRWCKNEKLYRGKDVENPPGFLAACIRRGRVVDYDNRSEVNDRLSRRRRLEELRRKEIRAQAEKSIERNGIAVRSVCDTPEKMRAFDSWIAGKGAHYRRVVDDGRKYPEGVAGKILESTRKGLIAEYQAEVLDAEKPAAGVDALLSGRAVRVKTHADGTKVFTVPIEHPDRPAAPKADMEWIDSFAGGKKAETNGKPAGEYMPPFINCRCGEKYQVMYRHFGGGVMPLFFPGDAKGLTPGNDDRRVFNCKCGENILHTYHGLRLSWSIDNSEKRDTS